MQKITGKAVLPEKKVKHVPKELPAISMKQVQ
jgi:hypothetical protein